jgi:hypothetical protein
MKVLSPLVLPTLTFAELPLATSYPGGIVVCPDFNGKIELIGSVGGEWTLLIS